jgi:type I restriction enzyme, S subunit
VSWPVVKLSDVATINPRPPRDVDASQQVTFVAMASASEDGYLLASEARILSETKKGFTYFDKNDVLLAKITPCFENGKCLRPGQIPTGIGFGSTEFHVIRPDTERLDGLYLFYLVWNEQFRFLGEKSMSGAAGQKRIGSDFLKGFEIPLPPLPEQKRIAAILDKADAIRRKRQQAIQLADDFLRAVFLDMFGDPGANPKGFNEVVLGELTTGKTNNGLFRKNDEYGGSVPVAWVGELFRGNKISFSEDANRIDPTEKEIDTYGLKYGDLLFCRSSLKLEGIGFNNIYLGDDDNALFECHLIRMSPCLEKVNPVFLNYQLRMPSVRARIFQQAKTSTMTTIDQAGLSRIKVFVPPLDLQEEFERKLIKVECLYSRLYKNKSLDELVFSSTSQKAFSGQL